MSDNPKLGQCCMCCTEKNVRNVLMLGYKAPIPGHGWGCFVCKLPADGAVAVLCDRCFDKLRGCKEDVTKHLRFACRGYPDQEGRIPLAELLKNPKHEHDKALHEKDDANFHMDPGTTNVPPTL